MARRKRKSSGDLPTGDEWLATYADCITLLMTFFVLLYSMSSVNEDKLKQVSAALQSVLSGTSGETILEYNGDVPIISTENEVMHETVKEFVEENGLDNVVDITEDSRGIVMQLRDNILFESGQADLIPESKGVLNAIGGLLGTFENGIIVEGHTDDVPISTYKYESNWELSSARAVNVVKYFVEEEKLSPIRFTAAGYGEYQPIVVNDSEENRAKNRRVSILISAKKEG